MEWMVTLTHLLGGLPGFIEQCVQDALYKVPEKCNES